MKKWRHRQQVNMRAPIISLRLPVTVDKHYGSTVYTVNDKQDKHQRVVLYAHGGAWFQDPLKIHFEFIDELAETLNAKVIMPVYPKIPHQDYQATYVLFEKLYHDLLNQVADSKQIVVMGGFCGRSNCFIICSIVKRKTYCATGTYCINFTSFRCNDAAS